MKGNLNVSKFSFGELVGTCKVYLIFSFWCLLEGRKCQKSKSKGKKLMVNILDLSINDRLIGRNDNGVNFYFFLVLAPSQF